MCCDDGLFYTLKCNVIDWCLRNFEFLWVVFLFDLYDDMTL